MHIDLQDIPSHHSHERFETIRSNVEQGHRSLLDIGAHWGCLCHRFEEEGFRCTAVENEAESLFFLRKLRRAENREFTVVDGSIFSLTEKGPLRHDVVLALAIFH